MRSQKVQLPLLLKILLLLLLSLLLSSCVLHSDLPILNVEAAKSKKVSTTESPSSPSANRTDVCDGHTLTRSAGFINQHFDVRFWKNFFRHLNPFTGRKRVKMQFYLYKRDFPDCGRELHLDNVASVEQAGFNGSQPTRILIHGWLSQSKGNLNRGVKNAYLQLLNKTVDNNDNSTMDERTTSNPHQSQIPEDYNIIVVDWGLISSNANYFSVVELIDDLGFLLAEFLRFLHLNASLHFGDVYIIGHSLGAQIAGSAGKQLQPYRINTIFALDPAGPKFRNMSSDRRVDASDADYVESIQTSTSFGIREPQGHATFYPNFGKSQRSCYGLGCSHRRAYHYFAESITSKAGFWGIRSERQADGSWLLVDVGKEYLMGGEPSTPKEGTFYVKTNKKSPYALGKQSWKDVVLNNEKIVEQDENSENENVSDGEQEENMVQIYT